MRYEVMDPLVRRGAVAMLLAHWMYLLGAAVVLLDTRSRPRFQRSFDARAAVDTAASSRRRLNTATSTQTLDTVGSAGTVDVWKHVFRTGGSVKTLHTSWEDARSPSSLCSGSSNQTEAASP